MKSRYLTREGVWMLFVLLFSADTFADIASYSAWWQGLAGYIVIVVVPALSGVAYGRSIK